MEMRVGINKGNGEYEATIPLHDMTELTQAIFALVGAILDDETTSTSNLEDMAKRVKYLTLNAVDEQARQGLDQD